MQQIILRYGLLSGAFAALLMLGTMQISNFDNGHIYGFTGIFISMLFVYFGVRAYREQVGGGVLSFGKGLQVGLLIALISCICYALAWMVVSATMMPDFMDKYAEHMLAKLQASGAAQAEIERQTAEIMQMKEMYKNPLVKFGFTLLEPTPVALPMALLSALILRKR